MRPLNHYGIFVLCFLFAFPLSAQHVFIQMESNPDTAVPGGLCADDIWQAPDSGYYTVGQYYHTMNDRDIYLCRTDKDGRAMWVKLYGGYYGDLSGTLTGDSLSVTIAMNLSNGTSTGQTMLLLHCDTSGNVLFSKQYGSSGSEEVDDIITVSSGGYLLCGATQGNAIPTSYNGILVRVNYVGDTLWTSEIDGPMGPDIFRQSVETPDQGFAICGYTTSFANGYSFYVVKVDSSGSLQWTDVFSGPVSGSHGMSIASLPNGSILAGGICDYGNGGTGFLTKLATNGDSLWTAAYPPLNSVTDIVPGNGGKIAITGHCNNWSDGYVAILDSNGNVLTATITTVPQFNPMEICSAYDGGYVMAGFQYISGYRRSLIVKTDSLGYTTCSQNLNVMKIYPALAKMSGGILQRDRHTKTTFGTLLLTAFPTPRFVIGTLE
jgi:hypothetical protein